MQNRLNDKNFGILMIGIIIFTRLAFSQNISEIASSFTSLKLLITSEKEQIFFSTVIYVNVSALSFFNYPTGIYLLHGIIVKH